LTLDLGFAAGLGIDMKQILLLVGVLALAGCGHSRMSYTPVPMGTFVEAQSIVEQVFLEDYVSDQRPQSVVVGPEYILLSDGLVTTGDSVASAAPIGVGAIAVGSSRSVTREEGQRIYYNSLGESTLHSRKFKANRYVILIRNTEGATLRRINTTNLDKAQRFLNALAFLRSERTR